MAFSRRITDGKIAASTTVTKKPDVSTPRPNCCVTCLARLIRKLKRKGRLLVSATADRRQASSLQCRYDPLSYSLNFDGGACGTLPDDEDYYFRFYAFSSRYVTNNAIKTRPPFPREILPASSHEFA
ncbi:Glucosamine 6-phosphate N-acetyltransferase [Hirschfeldia incana]|nr:Glucosamine 6-phosphate N-acetyltransferase [Hirschfeldia incana]